MTRLTLIVLLSSAAALAQADAGIAITAGGELAAVVTF